VSVSLPKPEEVISALVAFPPKFSVLVKPMTIPEDLFENTIKSATGVEVPPGPNKMLASLMAGFEGATPSAVLPIPGIPAPAPSPAPSTAPSEKAGFEIK